MTRQEALCRELAAGKGWPVAKVYSDNDLSAYSGKRRPAYEEMLADLEARAIDAVLVVDQDRLTRHPAELESFIALADRLGVALANVSGDIDLSTSDGRFRARILGAVARQESEKKSERLKRQRDQHARLGLAHGGIRRFGYRPVRENGAAVLELVEAEAALIREATSRFLAGESLSQIALDWNRQKIPTVTGSTWRVTTLRTLLTGPHLAGLRVHRGEIVGNANWPAVLDRETWERVGAVLGDPRRAQKGRPAAHLLTGLVKCGKCGASVYSGRRPDGSRRYTCNFEAGRGCGRISVVAEPLEAHVSAYVLSALDSPQMAEALASAPDVDRSAVARQIEEDEGRLEALARDHYAEGIISKREYLAARESIEARLAGSRRQIVTATPATLPAGEDVRKLWASADVSTRRAIIALVVESVVIGPGTPGRKAFDPTRVTVNRL
ncbi:MAG: recombinase family protein [Acidimicrobiia bacterium]